MGKWINCRKCGHQYHSSLSKCPECGNLTITLNKILGFSVLGLVLAVAAVGIVFGFMDKGSDKPQISDQSSVQSVLDSSSVNTESEVEIKPESESQPTISDNSSSDKVSSKEETVLNESNVSSKTETTPSTPELPITPNIGTVLKDGKVYITVPEYYLRAMHGILSAAGDIDFEEFAYSMTEEEKLDGGLYVVKNADGSATSVVTEKYYAEIRKDAVKQCHKILKQLEYYDFVTRTSNSNDFEGVILFLNVNEFPEQYISLINAAGITFLYNQYLIPESDNSCVIELVYANQEKEKLEFPQILK